jgi:hypothetical protein
VITNYHFILKIWPIGPRLCGEAAKQARWREPARLDAVPHAAQTRIKYMKTGNALSKAKGFSGLAGLSSVDIGGGLPL